MSKTSYGYKSTTDGQNIISKSLLRWRRQHFIGFDIKRSSVRRIERRYDFAACLALNPHLERFGLGRWNRLNDAEHLLGGSHVRHAHLAVRRSQFQSVTVCHGFISFGFKPLFQLPPVCKGVFAFGQHCNTSTMEKYHISASPSQTERILRSPKIFMISSLGIDYPYIIPFCIRSLGSITRR